MGESTAPSKRKRILKICIITVVVIAVLLCAIALFTFLQFPRVRSGLIESRNYAARRVEYEVSEHLDTLQLPQNETVILMGEYVWGKHLMIYANQWLPEDECLYHSDSNETLSYWAMRITVDAREVWFGEQPIEESQLHPYTNAEQENSVYFVTPFTPARWCSESWTDDSELIGYYKHILTQSE